VGAAPYDFFDRYGAELPETFVRELAEKLMQSRSAVSKEEYCVAKAERGYREKEQNVQLLSKTKSGEDVVVGIYEDVRK